MGQFMDFMDDFVFGPLNLITRAEGLVKQQIYHDTAVKFSILRIDKGGIHTQNDVKRILDKYQIPAFGWTHDSRCLHFLIKSRQANWTEYLLLLASIQLQNPPVNPKNLDYVKRHPPGWMPPAWADQANADDQIDDDQPLEQSYRNEDEQVDEIDNDRQAPEIRAPLSRLFHWLDTL